MANKNTKLKKIMFVLAGNLLIFILVELLCNLFLFVLPPNIYNLDYAKKEDYKNITGPFAPNQNVILQYSVPYSISINSQGLRGKEFTIEKHKNRILAVGDSVTLGFCISREKELFSQVLEDSINKDSSKNYEVINCGIGGTTIKGQYRFIKEKLLRLKPDIVVITFCSNDVSDLRAKKGTYSEIRELILENKTPLIERSGIYKFIHRMYLAYLVKNKVLGKPKHFNLSKRVDFSVDEVIKGFEKAFKRNDMIMLKDPIPAEVEKLWGDYEEYLYMTKKMLDEHNTRLVLAAVPAIPQMFLKDYSRDPQKRLKKMCEKIGIGYIDYLPVFFNDKNKKQLCCLPYDFHPSAYGHEVIGKTLYAYLKRENYLVGQ